ncbi:MAG TPA: reverse transcriptase domain-containing protein [Candidatus Sulfotelmatobacter sp.]|nr:reverse transcriptase domain-containing protein [Candidatus Sulfotelmatobacter sp.]
MQQKIRRSGSQSIALKTPQKKRNNTDDKCYVTVPALRASVREPSYFDSIPHADLLQSVARRVVDRAMLHLIKMWLEAPVEEIDERGNKHRSTRNRDEGRSPPQGAPISPLLSNLYMRRKVLGWKKLGHEKRLKAYIINYADDLVIGCRTRADEALVAMRTMMSRLKLTVNESKTRVCRLPEEKFDFLGYSFGRCYSPKTGRAYGGTTASKKRVQRLCKSISEMTRRSQTPQDAATLVAALNRKLIGWANYFCLGPVRKAYQGVEQDACRRLRRWLCVQHKERAAGNVRFPQRVLHEKFGLVPLTVRTSSFPWARTGTFLRQLDALTAPVPFDKRGCGNEARCGY